MAGAVEVDEGRAVPSCAARAAALLAARAAFFGFSVGRGFDGEAAGVVPAAEVDAALMPDWVDAAGFFGGFALLELPPVSSLLSSMTIGVLGALGLRVRFNVQHSLSLTIAFVTIGYHLWVFCCLFECHHGIGKGMAAPASAISNSQS